MMPLSPLLHVSQTPYPKPWLVANIHKHSSSRLASGSKELHSQFPVLFILVCVLGLGLCNLCLLPSHRLQASHVLVIAAMIGKDRDVVLQATDALLPALAMSSLAMPACCKGMMLEAMGADVGLTGRVEAHQSSVHQPRQSDLRLKTAHVHVWTGQ